jgi:uncharacterized protein YeeX (DUF496 family)
MSRRFRRRNPLARELRNPQYDMKVVDKKKRHLLRKLYEQEAEEELKNLDG